MANVKQGESFPLFLTLLKLQFLVQDLLSVVLVQICVIKSTKELLKMRFSSLVANDNTDKLLEQDNLFLEKMFI